jgi:hypothetical protein
MALSAEFVAAFEAEYDRVLAAHQGRHHLRARRNRRMADGMVGKDYTAAVELVNLLYAQLTALVQGAVEALQDGKLSTVEGVTLALRATNAALAIQTELEDTAPSLRQDILHVLRHGQLVLPETGG